MNDVATIAAPADLEARLPAVVKWARELKITSPAERLDASEKRQGIKAAIKQAIDFFKPMKRKADETKAAILAAEHKILDPYKEADDLAEKALLTFDRQETAKAEAMRRQLQEAENAAKAKERALAEAEAARQRQIEADARAKAEAARREAEQATVAARRKLLAQAAAAEAKAQSAAVKQESAQEAAIAAVPTVISVAQPILKAAGESKRTTWKAEVADASAFLRWACTNGRTDLLLPNEKVLDSLAKGLREAAIGTIPGVRFFAKETLASKGA